MRLDEFLNSLDEKLSPYADWIREIDSLSREERIKLIPKFRKLAADAAEDYSREDLGLPRLHGNSIERSKAYNFYRKMKLGG